MTDTEARPDPGMKLYLVVWVGLLLIVAVETWLAYAHLATGTLFTALLLLALIEAALGLMYFMHLRYERPALFWSWIPYLIFAMLMLNQIWPDANRLLHLRAPTP